MVHFTLPESTLTSSSGDTKQSPRPVVLFIHGDSFDWGSGNLYDGAVMAAYSDLVVVTINYRLGVLGNSDQPHFQPNSSEIMIPKVLKSHKGWTKIIKEIWWLFWRFSRD